MNQHNTSSARTKHFFCKNMSTGNPILQCACGMPCARKAGSAVARQDKFYFSCVNYGVQRRVCEVYVWEDVLEEHMQKRIQAERVKLREVTEDRDEFIEEMADRNREIRNLRTMNKVLQLALASTAPVVAMIAIGAAWVGK
ncbi:hypothetical protein VPH35_023414 [Triticum aestivum]